MSAAADRGEACFSLRHRLLPSLKLWQDKSAGQVAQGFAGQDS
jgi:hypothetical protein